jgi:predicted nucleic acid-binding protein
VNASAVVDASVVLKWVLPEPDSDVARRLASWNLVAPEFLLLECGNALWVRARRGLMPSEDVPIVVEQLLAAPIRLVVGKDLIRGALALAARLDHPIYDCGYLALARTENVPVVTADARFVAAVRRAKDDAIPTILPLADIGRWM